MVKLTPYSGLYFRHVQKAKKLPMLFNKVILLIQLINRAIEKNACLLKSFIAAAQVNFFV